MKESIINPFEHTANGEMGIITSITSPVIAKGRFYGVVGIDMQLDFLQTKADKLDVYDKTGKMVVISNNGTLCASAAPLPAYLCRVLGVAW